MEVINPSRLVNSQRMMTLVLLKQTVLGIAECLQCSICSYLIQMPVVTRCGHPFCHTCISTVLDQRDPLCPICNTLLTRRSVHKDEQIEQRISKLWQIIHAICADNAEMYKNEPTASTSEDRSSRHDEQRIDIIDRAFQRPTDREHCNNGEQMPVKWFDHNPVKSLENTDNDEQQTVEEKYASPNQQTPKKICLSLKRNRESSSKISICSETSRSPESPRVPSPVTRDLQDTIPSVFEESEIRTPPKRQESAITETPRKNTLSLNRNSNLKADRNQHNGGYNVQVESAKRNLNDEICHIKIANVWSLAKDVNRKNVDVDKEAPSVREKNTIARSAKRWVSRRLKFEKLSKLVNLYPSNCYFLYRAFCKRKRTSVRRRVKIRKMKSVTATSLKDKTCDVEVDQVSLKDKSVSSRKVSPVPDEKECEVTRSLSQTLQTAGPSATRETNVSIEGVNLCTSKTLPTNSAPTDVANQTFTISKTTDAPRDDKVESSSYPCVKSYKEVASGLSTNIWFNSLQPHDDLERTPSSKNNKSEGNCLPRDANTNIPRFSITVPFKKPVEICNMSTNDEGPNVGNKRVNSNTETSENSLKESTLNTEMFSMFPGSTMQVNREFIKSVDFDAEFFEAAKGSVEPMRVQVGPRSNHKVLSIIGTCATKRPSDSSSRAPRTSGPPSKLLKYDQKINKDPKPSTPKLSTNNSEVNEVAECADVRKNLPNENLTEDSPASKEGRSKDSRKVEKSNSYIKQDVSNEEDKKASKFSPAKDDEILPRSCNSKSAKRADILDGEEYEQIELNDQDAVVGHQMLSNKLEQVSFTNRIIRTPENLARTKSFSGENRERPRSSVEDRHSECAAKDDDVIIVDILPAKSKIIPCSARRRLSQLSDVHAVGQKIEESCQNRFCLVGSHLLPEQMVRMMKFACFMSIPYVDEFSKDVTHVVVNTDEVNATEKTLNYIRGIAHRKWVVSFQWVQDCMASMKMLKEEPYEVLDAASLEPGPRNSRLRTKELFEGFTFLCVECFSYITRSQYQELLGLTGATVVRSMPELVRANSKLKCVVFQANTRKTEALEASIRARLLPVTYDWIVDCISRYKLLPLRAYLQEIQAIDVFAVRPLNELLMEGKFNSKDKPRCGTT